MLIATKKQKIFAIVLMLILQSCYGIATISKKEKVTKYPDFIVLDERGKYTKNKTGSKVAHPQVVHEPKTLNTKPAEFDFNFDSTKESVWKFNKKSGMLDVEKESVPQIGMGKENRKKLTQVYVGPKYSREAILELWGEPNSKYVKEGVEYWKYQNEIGFSGVLIGLIIPIPIMVPVGYRYTILSFNEYYLENISYEMSDMTHGIFCALSICIDKDTILVDEI
jgi:hypothetical protein